MARCPELAHVCRLPELVQRLCVEAITAWIQYQALPWPIWLVNQGEISSAASPRRHSYSLGTGAPHRMCAAQEI